MASAVEPQAFAPRMVGRYLLYGEIASGGMASVHFGRLVGPAGFARPVAIKRLHAHFARDPDFVKMFLDEARLAARIAHPNVVPTLDVVNVDSEVFIVMEYVRGVTLAHLARTVRERGGRIQPLVALGIVSGMLQGLHAAHEARNDLGEPLDLVHRDVSPQNALVGTDGVTRLLDFGVAKATGRLQTTRDGQLKGKLAYMAPEQVRGETVTRRTDIYAASVVLWEALTGKRLFYASNEANVLANVLSGEVLPPSTVVPDLPRALDPIVLRGLERDPSKRFASARAMAAEVDACIGIASPTEIGDWVEQTASEELQAHARRIGSMERAAVSPESPTGVIPRGGDEPGTRREPRPSDRPTTTGWSPKATPEASAHRSKWLLPGAALGLALAMMVSSFVALYVSSKRTAAAGQGPAVVSPAPPASSASAEPPVASASASAVRAEEPAPAVPGSSAVSTASPDDGKTPRATAPAPRSSASPAASSGTRRTRPPAGGDCNPPYTLDAKGHVLFKPNCL